MAIESLYRFGQLRVEKCEPPGSGHDDDQHHSLTPDFQRLQMQAVGLSIRRKSYDA